MTPRFTIAGLLILTGVCCVFLTAYRLLNPPPEYPIVAYPAYQRLRSDVGPIRYESNITPEAIKAAPKWNRRKLVPPIPAGRAIILAHQLCNDLIEQKKLEDQFWQVAGADLEPYDGSSGQWFWVIRFQGDWNKGAGPPTTLDIVVLMDGTVVQPEIWSLD